MSQSSAKKPSSSIFTAPKWVNSFYSQFPLVTLEQQDLLDWKKVETQRLGSKSPFTIWVQPPSSKAGNSHFKAWASNDPASLRAQLLFLLRGIPISVRPWTNEAAAPQGKLPTLHITTENRLVAADDIRPWLDSNHPLQGKNAELHGMPSQEAYDEALAIAQLVLVKLLPAYLVSKPTGPPSSLPLLFPEPPALLAGLTTPLPASLTGDERVLDESNIIESGLDALDALHAKIGSSWALNAKSPTPLDALLASHFYCIYNLPASSPLCSKLEDTPEIGEYIDRVFAYADKVLA